MAPSPPRISRVVRKLLLVAIDFLTTADRRRAMGTIGAGPDRITFKAIVTSPRGGSYQPARLEPLQHGVRNRRPHRQVPPRSRV